MGAGDGSHARVEAPISMCTIMVHSYVISYDECFTHGPYSACQDDMRSSTKLFSPQYLANEQEMGSDNTIILTGSGLFSISTQDLVDLMGISQIIIGRRFATGT